MSGVLMLDVPFSEKDQAKALGARWNASLKKWYVPADLNIVEFRRWIPNGGKEFAMIAFSPIYLVQSWEPCWRCENVAPVYCLASEGVEDVDGRLRHLFFLSSLEKVPEEVEKIIKAYAPTYFMDYTKKSDSHYFVNHCSCGAKLGDFYLHNEPGGAFVPMSREDASLIAMKRLNAIGDIKVQAAYGTSSEDFIAKGAQRGEI